MVFLAQFSTLAVIPVKQAKDMKSSRMMLLPPERPNNSEFYSSLDELMIAVNQFAGDQGYAIVMKRTKRSMKGVLREATLACDRGKKNKPQG